jgi:hypothetical protein
MNGVAASSVAGVDRTPGRASTAKRRRDGSALLTENSAGRAERSVARSAGTERSSAASSRANAPAVTLRFVTRPFSALSFSTSAEKVFCWPRSTRWRSRVGSWPSVASLASEVFL